MFIKYVDLRFNNRHWLMLIYLSHQLDPLWYNKYGLKLYELIKSIVI